jgi:hypothetical protein
MIGKGRKSFLERVESGRLSTRVSNRLEQSFVAQKIAADVPPGISIFWMLR